MVGPETGAWVAEFLLRQPLEDWLADEIFLALPLPSRPPYRVRRALLLRRLASDLSGRSPSLRTLHTLDLIVDDLTASSSSSESMSAAYRAVSRHCVALKASSDDGSFTTFVEGLSSRVAGLERAMPAVLAAESLRELRMEIEAVAGGDAVKAAFLQKDTRKEALDAMRAYLKAAEEELGPSILERLAEAVVSNRIELGEEALRELGEKKDKGSGVAGRVEETNSGLSDAVADHEINREEVAHLELSSSSTSLEEEDVAAVHLGKLNDKFNPVPTPEVENMSNALESSCMNPNTAGVDPLLDATVQATEVLRKSRSVMMTNDVEQQGVHVSVVEKDANNDNGATETVHAGMEDPIKSSSHTSPSSSKKIFLPSPMEQKVSPLRNIDNKQFEKRRKAKRWSNLEVDALRKAVQKYGKGNWKRILNSCSEIFKDRTEVDLKDKWRNMTRL